MSSTPTYRLSSSLRGPAFSIAVVTGILLAIVMVASLFVANRMPGLERVAWLRNLLSSGAFALVMAIPVARFFRRPLCMFSSGMAAWLIFVLSYTCATGYFENLVNRMGKTPFLMLVLGAITYGVIAVIAWVAAVLYGLMHHPAVEHHPATVEVAHRSR